MVKELLYHCLTADFCLSLVSMLIQMMFADPQASTEQPSAAGTGSRGRAVLALDPS